MEAAPRLQRGGQLQCKNLHEFLRGLSPPLLDRLYGHPATCLAVFRELPGLAQVGVMRMLFLEQPLPHAAVGLWVKKEHSKEQADSQEMLLALRLWHPHTLPGGLPGWSCTPNSARTSASLCWGGAARGRTTPPHWAPINTPGLCPRWINTPRNVGRLYCISWWGPPARR
uniref:General transcription factor IIH subunit 4 n=1 Tax=Gallus gallus TaxID=9031 RepID=A0A8V0X4X9_CHICK